MIQDDHRNNDMLYINFCMFHFQSLRPPEHLSAQRYTSIRFYGYLGLYVYDSSLSGHYTSCVGVTGDFHSLTICNPESTISLQLVECKLKDSSGNSRSALCLRCLVHVEQVKVRLKLWGYQRQSVC